LSDVNAFKNLYDKIKFLNGELKKLIKPNNQPKIQNNIFPSASNYNQKLSNENKMIDSNSKNNQHMQSRQFDIPVNRKEFSNNFNPPGSQLNYQEIENKKSINYYNNFGNNNIKQNVVENQALNNNRNSVLNRDKNPLRKESPSNKISDNKKTYPVIDINNYDFPFEFNEQKMILESLDNPKSNKNNYKDFCLVNEPDQSFDKFLKKQDKKEHANLNQKPNEEFPFYYVQEEVNNDIECQICTDKFNFLDQENAFLDCNCIIHGLCFTSYIENEVTQNNLPINCPNQSCRKEVNPGIILKLIKNNETLFKKYEKFTLSYYQKTKEDIFSCPTPDCDYVFFNDQEQNRFDCPKCKNSYCLKCNVKFHANQTCQEYNRMNKEQVKNPIKNRNKIRISMT